MDATLPTTGATYRAWLRLPQNTMGSTLFSLAMCVRVPYFGSIFPRVRSMSPGECTVTAPRWWGIRNHLGTFHAIAACNLAEVPMGMLAEATVPTTHRWIPKEMNVRYLAKATTSLTAIAELAELPDFDDSIGDGFDLLVPVSVTDAHGLEVVHADITVWVSRNR
ncbi:DUF4442 domain-containing protein [Rhodococcus sp. PAMC28707]|uniref:hotdog fold domain-containing protein n=1 Tax=unclassified Rhodococcus (in: high G+C Gram-positive bacteria) TaxID=192944 RepID=UPI00109D9F55|nr:MULTISPECIES: hotdog fold domain-containing protein [unclassified Rhodococcus (in: high G+C Gram-positive bacteria)]QCB50495.1 DUF4442 domain-containing protein [Rhodococcus sp. PAMC28705]QCB57813.1 DUF4442 domain-containing protein [Rhodococcus sp. PAMC28707]